MPLIVLTADRPHELRGSGANQTIDQVKIFGDVIDFFADAPLPETDPPPVVLRHLRTLAARASATARNRQDVVHINFPFRKPLEPAADDNMQIDRRAPTRFVESGRVRSSGLLPLLDDDVLQRRGIIYFGHGSCRSGAERRALLPWAQRLSTITGYPILAEFSSNMRSATAVGAYESCMTLPAVDFSQVEVVIRFGTPPLSKHMQDFMAKAPLPYHIYCSRAGEWADDNHSITHHLTVHPADVSPSEWDDLTGTASVFERLARPSVARRESCSADYRRRNRDRTLFRRRRAL